MNDFLLPFLISNSIALLLLIFSFRWTIVAKYLWAFIFLAAGGINLFFSQSKPDIYVQSFGPPAIDLYQRFIYGFFSQYTEFMVLTIAIGQLLVGVLLLCHNKLFRLGILGGTVFLLAIAPLGIGSAFPATLLGAISLVVLLQQTKYAEEE